MWNKRVTDYLIMERTPANNDKPSLQQEGLFALTLINRIFLRAKNIEICIDGIRLGKVNMIFPRPLDEVAYVSGLVFDKLVWGKRRYRFIRQLNLRVGFREIETYRLAYWRPISHENFQKLLDISNKFDQYVMDFGRYIRDSHKKEWLRRLQDARSLLELEGEYQLLGFDVAEIKPQLLAFLTDADKFVEFHNTSYLKEHLKQSHALFDSLEEHPLTDRQRDACVNDEDNVLIIAGAGTGKTSTMYAKAAYLVQKGYARPEDILMLAFGRDARIELENRVNKQGYLQGTVIKTFHALGKEIIGTYEDRATDVSVLSTDKSQFIKYIDHQIEQLFQDTSLTASLQSFFSTYLHHQPNDMDFKSHGEYLKFVKDNDIRDLAGNNVKSFEELTISNYLYTNGISFQYEAAYPHPVSSPGRSVYKPDYYLPDLDVYIEHFGINEKGETRPGIDKDKYNKDREWKISVHQKYGTTLIQTFSYQSKYGLGKVLEEALTRYCLENEIELENILKPVSASTMYARLKELGIYKKFSKLISVFLTLFKASAYSLDDIQNMGGHGYEKTRYRLFYHIFDWVYQRYMSDLKKNGTMDFSDMVRNAIDIVGRDDFHARTGSRYRFKYIMVDEFQDISPVRAELVKALRDAGNQCALFSVGDDWQAIYRFTGSDVELTTEFSQHFGVTNTIYLDKTFRFNDRIEGVASGFVQVNPRQLRKDLVTQTKSNNTEVHVVSGDPEGLCRGLLSQILSETKKDASVLILSRFTKTYKNVEHLRQQFPSLDIKFMTAHRSKGKQADYVILLEVTDDAYGFPSKMVTDPILEYLLPNLESFAYAEERRLFYVALTRAKKRVYIHTDLGKESQFLKELRDTKADVLFEHNKLSKYVIDSARCPECCVGNLVPFDGQYGLFYVCSLGQRYCDTRVPACPECGVAPLQRDEIRYFCASAECAYEADCCPQCGTGRLVVRENSKGMKFLGCTNYRRGADISCSYTRSINTHSNILNH